MCAHEFSTGHLGTHFEPGHAGLFQCPYTNTDICSTPIAQTSLPSQLQAPKRPIPHPGSPSQGTCGAGEDPRASPQCAPPCHPVPSPQCERGMGDAGMPREGPALQAIARASPRDVPGSCCQLVDKYCRLCYESGMSGARGQGQAPAAETRVGKHRDITKHHGGVMWPPGDISEGFSRPVQLLLLLPSVQLLQLSCTSVAPLPSQEAHQAGHWATRDSSWVREVFTCSSKSCPGTMTPPPNMESWNCLG